VRTLALRLSNSGRASARTLPEQRSQARHLRALHNVEWVVYAKSAFGGPQQALEYLGRYTLRVAIANSRRCLNPSS